jgi:hypothetical protein
MATRTKQVHVIGTEAQMADPAYEGALVVDTTRDGSEIIIRESKLGPKIKIPVALLDDVIAALTALKPSASPRP